MWAEYNRNGTNEMQLMKKWEESTSKVESDHKDVNSLIMWQVKFK